MTNHAILYGVCNVKLQLYAKGFAWSRWGGGHFKRLSISYTLNSKNRVLNPYPNWYLSNEKSTFADNWRAEHTILCMEKKFLRNFFLAILNGNSSLRLPMSFIIFLGLLIILVCIVLYKLHLPETIKYSHNEVG